MRLFLSLVPFLCLFGGGAISAQTQFHIKDSTCKELQISFADSLYVLPLRNGKASLQLMGEPGYALIYSKHRSNNIYIYPGKMQQICLDSLKHWSFQGAGKEINDYLQCDFLQTLSLPYAVDENIFLQQWDSLRQCVACHLNKLHLPEDFVNKEKRRLHYVMCNLLLDYPFRHTRIIGKTYMPSVAYYTCLDKVMQESDCDNWEYRQAFNKWVDQQCARRGKANTHMESFTWRLYYIRDSLNDRRLKDYLIHELFYWQVRHHGANGLDSFLPEYRKYVSQNSRMREFTQLYEHYARLQKGQEAPAFSLTDIHGKTVSLRDLRGKYVYIDVWASWCIPCCKEMPKLQVLEKEFAEKPIAFVSISIDENENAWKRKVQEEALKGIQLHAGKSNFKRLYQITLVPRFILITPDGKIENANMTRPSDAQTRETLHALIGK